MTTARGFDASFNAPCRACPRTTHPSRLARFLRKAEAELTVAWMLAPLAIALITALLPFIVA